MEFMNVVRMRVKEGCLEEFMGVLEAETVRTEKAEGLTSFVVARTSDRDFCIVGRWTSEAALAAARPMLISSLDEMRHLLVSLSDELGVTDPVSGPVVMAIGH